MLDINSLLGIQFIDIFSHPIGCLFVDYFSCYIEAFSLMKSNFSFVCTFGVKSKRLLPIPKSRRFSYVLPSGSVKALCFTLKSLNHFQLIFLYMVKCIFPFLKSTWKHLVFLIFYLSTFLSNWIALSVAIQDSYLKDDWCNIYGCV